MMRQREEGKFDVTGGGSNERETEAMALGRIPV